MFRLLSPFPKRDVLKEGAQGSKYPGRHKNLFLKVEENAQRFQINGRGRKRNTSDGGTIPCVETVQSSR